MYVCAHEKLVTCECFSFCRHCKYKSVDYIHSYSFFFFFFNPSVGVGEEEKSVVVVRAWWNTVFQHAYMMCNNVPKKKKKKKCMVEIKNKEELKLTPQSYPPGMTDNETVDEMNQTHDEIGGFVCFCTVICNSTTK